MVPLCACCLQKTKIQTLAKKVKLMGGVVVVVVEGENMLQLEDGTPSTVGGIPNTGSLAGNAVLLPERRPPARRHK